MKRKRCRSCNDLFSPFTSLQIACKTECAIALSKTKEGSDHAKKAYQRDTALMKKVFYASDIKTRKEAAKKACHEYIRERDKNKGCITCGNPLGSKFDAGHFLKGTNSYTKFMEKNIHGQCVNCNQYNGGREREYEHALIAKYGHITVLALKKLRTKTVKRTVDDYKAIEAHYKNKLKALGE